ncbi:hypothetical protein BDV40DRAFT_279788 [Aspergillus tamarii]|uniref:Uncharacterized protein n=1 Tax=Aspergillus tamarii TaxID=41984 RepID=A0A5N6UEJ2_ASPTM|nr:hypothetical protein BDV40DRAFT_279788 [Aspergillus tamarii]
MSRLNGICGVRVEASPQSVLLGLFLNKALLGVFDSFILFYSILFWLKQYLIGLASSVIPRASSPSVQSSA